MTIARNRRAGIGLALLSAASFSMSGSFARSLIDAGWTPGAAVAVRISVAALLLAIPAIVSLHGRWSLLRRDPVTLGAYGIVAFAGAQLCYFNAVQHISVGVALLLDLLSDIRLDPAGVLWGLAAAVGLASYFVLSARIATYLPPLVVA